MPLTIEVTSSPTQSGASFTSEPMYSVMRSAHGASENLSSGPDLGRPRCEQAATLAPASSRYFRVGTDARMRVSSVMVLPSSGTLRSQRTRTFLPLRSAAERSPTDFLTISMSLERATRELANLDTPTGE